MSAGTNRQVDSIKAKLCQGFGEPGIVFDPTEVFRKEANGRFSRGAGMTGSSHSMSLESAQERNSTGYSQKVAAAKARRHGLTQDVDLIEDPRKEKSPGSEFCAPPRRGLAA